MITVDEALDLVLSTSTSFGIKQIPLSKCIGHVLAENIFSDRPVPPFDRVTMDGIAINYTNYKNGQREFIIESIAPAGSPQQNLLNPAHCIEVMTGACLPNGTDTVIRYEDLTKLDSKYRINIDVIAGKNVHMKGSDHDLDLPLIEQYSVIKAIDINVLASIGKSYVPVLKMPKIAVISSGDELVEISDIPKDYQIRKSNVYMLLSRLDQLNVTAETFHLEDDVNDITKSISNILTTYDVVLLSGGVSKGKFDFIPEALENLKVNKLFHKVAQRPGKPFWFGQKGKQVVFAFPGNPVSTLACFHKYFIPWLNQCLKQSLNHFKVKLDNDVTFKPDLHYLAQGKLRQSDDGIWYVTVLHGKGSGDLVSPTKMDGFVDLPKGKETYLKGDIYNFIPFYPIFP